MDKQMTKKQKKQKCTAFFFKKNTSKPQGREQSWLGAMETQER
jgi:hypothetical protein